MSASDLLFALEFVYEGAEDEGPSRLESLLTLLEFKGDLKKQVVVMMGLPGAGKSFFIKNEGQKYIPGFKGYKTSNSDIQLRRIQFEKATQDYAALSKAKSEDEYEKIAKEFWYLGNEGKRHEFPLPFDWFKQFKNFKEFFRVAFKRYYATYFTQLREIASQRDLKLFDTKIITSGAVLVIDTIGASTGKILDRLKKAKQEDFQVTIIYLEFPIDNSIARDIERGQRKGRTVGMKVIRGYAGRMGGAWKTYVSAAKSGGDIDRLLHFKWNATGAGLYDGQYRKVFDKRYDVERDIEALKRDKAGKPVRKTG